MPRQNTENRFNNAGKHMVNSTTQHTEATGAAKIDAPDNKTSKSKVINARVFPETWEAFTKINKAKGMSNSSVMSMLVTEYIRNNETLI